jgi:aerobic carbon-monoxide dehydrogenase large subunit
MSATGIGARVRRTEDQRFITGRGQYTDDIHRPYETYCCFVRSPHAHATIKASTRRKPKNAGRPRHPDRRRRRRGQARRPLLRLDGVSKDGSPMNAGSHPALAKGKVRYVGDHVAVVIAETPRPGPKTAAAEVNVSYGVLPAVADLAKAREPQIRANPRKRAEQHGL